MAWAEGEILGWPHTTGTWEEPAGSLPWLWAPGGVLSGLGGVELQLRSFAGVRDTASPGVSQEKAQGEWGAPSMGQACALRTLLCLSFLTLSI